MSPSNTPRAMDTGLLRERLIGAEFDDREFEPPYVPGREGNAAEMPGQGSLLASRQTSVLGSDAAVMASQAPGPQSETIARTSKDVLSRVGSSNELDRGQAQEDRLQRQEVEAQQTPRSHLARPSPSLSCMERGRPRGRGPTTRNPSPEENRMEQMAYLMESMMARMER